MSVEFDRFEIELRAMCPGLYLSAHGRRQCICTNLDAWYIERGEPLPSWANQGEVLPTSVEAEETTEAQAARE